MKATIDAAGRLLIPPQLRARLGLLPGEVEVVADGADLLVRPVADDLLDDLDGWLVVPESGSELTDGVVSELRAADQR